MSDYALVRQLAQIDLFAGVSDKVLRRIAERGELAKFEPLAHVVEQGSQVSGWAAFSPEGVRFYLILDGSANVEVHGIRRGTLGPGQYFGEAALIDGEPRSATVIAGPAGLSAFALSAWAFKPILEENPPVALAMLKVLARRVREAESRS
jgi:CRP/FNR family transcriptional regulator, cyclic AMP receptor protein